MGEAGTGSGLRHARLVGVSSCILHLLDLGLLPAFDNLGSLGGGGHCRYNVRSRTHKLNISGVSGEIPAYDIEALFSPTRIEAYVIRNYTSCKGGLWHARHSYQHVLEISSCPFQPLAPGLLCIRAIAIYRLVFQSCNLSFSQCIPLRISAPRPSVAHMAVWGFKLCPYESKRNGRYW